jgi:WD40 repeat protein
LRGEKLFKVPPKNDLRCLEYNPTVVGLCLSLYLYASVSPSLHAQVESVESTEASHYSWVSHGRIEGHLALNHSPSGAISPDSSTLAIANGDKVLLMELANAGVRRVLHPHLESITDLDIESADFLSPTRLFLLAVGLIHEKGSKGVLPRTPLLAFQWYIDQDSLFEKLNAIGNHPGIGPIFYFPQIKHLGIYTPKQFEFWNPESHRGGDISVPELTRRPNLFAVSPDGHWLLAAQIESSSTPDPVVVELREHKIVDSLRGHQATVLDISFARDSSRVVTACEDGKVRIWSVPDWKLLQTLSGHQGPVHWAEFSPDGNWVVSGSEDKAVRIWSVDGKLEQTLEESQAPILTVAFSPNGEYVAASTEQNVLVWKRSHR